MLAAGAGCSHGLMNRQILRYRVFFDLWKRGYCLTPGLKYSADYLVYAGVYKSERERERESARVRVIVCLMPVS